MQPEKPQQSQPSPETEAAQASSGENLTGMQPEKPQPAVAEKSPQNHDPSGAQPAAAAVASIDPITQQPAAANQSPASGSLNVPATAADEDLIEKPWVQAAEHVIDAYSDDPKTEETAHQTLSRDYKKKRFKFDIDKP